MVSAKILSTKKLSGNHKTFLLNAGLSVIEADFITVRLCDFTFEKDNSNFIFTSSNAVKSVIAKKGVYNSNKCFCVGENTRSLLISYGFTIEATRDNAFDLATLIIDQYSNDDFTFFCGNLRFDVLPKILADSKVRFNEINVYNTVLSPQKIEATVDGILFFSPSAVESYIEKNTIKDQMCFCIGTTTAKALQSLTERIVVANKPTIENTIIQAINFYKNS